MILFWLSRYRALARRSSGFFGEAHAWKDV